MNRFIDVLAVLLATAAPMAAAAQTPTGQQQTEQAQQRLAQIKDRLELTPEQVDQVRPVLIEEVQKLKALREKYAGDDGRRARRKMGRELRDIRSETDDRLKKILSKEQMDEMKKIREEWRQEFKNRAAAK